MIRYATLRTAGAAVAAILALSAASASADDAVASDKAAKLQNFASPIVFTQGGTPPVTAPSNVTCYLTNVGDETVKVKNLKMVANGTSLTLNANACGSPLGFDLAPKKTCFIGNTQRTAFGYACAAVTKDPSSLRGSIELRDASANVLSSGDMTAVSDAAGDGFTQIASPAFFGSPDQTYAQCTFVNVGTEAALIRKVKIVRSTGEKVDVSYKSCGDASQTSIAPNKQCAYLAQSIAPASDLQCIGEVTHRADIRASFVIGKPTSFTLNGHVMD